MQTRPTINDDRVITIAAQALLDQLVADGAEFDDTDDTLHDLTQALTMETDGYHIGRYLEDEGWTMHAGLIEIFDEAMDLRLEAHRQLVREWVLNEGILPTRQLGDTVTIDHQGQRVVGVIDRIDTRQGTYLVRCHSLGHVPQGQRGVHGFVINYEDILDATPIITDPELE